MIFDNFVKMKIRKLRVHRLFKYAKRKKKKRKKKKKKMQNFQQCNYTLVQQRGKKVFFELFTMPFFCHFVHRKKTLLISKLKMQPKQRTLTKNIYLKIYIYFNF